MPLGCHSLNHSWRRTLSSFVFGPTRQLQGCGRCHFLQHHQVRLGIIQPPAQGLKVGRAIEQIRTSDVNCQARWLMHPRSQPREAPGWMERPATASPTQPIVATPAALSPVVALAPASPIPRTASEHQSSCQCVKRSSAHEISSPQLTAAKLRSGVRLPPTPSTRQT